MEEPKYTRHTYANGIIVDVVHNPMWDDMIETETKREIMENKDYWGYFRENWKWRSYYDKDESRREEPVEFTLSEMETDHIIRCMLYSIHHNLTPNTNNMAVFLTELLYRNERGI